MLLEKHSVCTHGLVVVPFFSSDWWISALVDFLKCSFFYQAWFEIVRLCWTLEVIRSDWTISNEMPGSSEGNYFFFEFVLVISRECINFVHDILGILDRINAESVSLPACALKEGKLPFHLLHLVHLVINEHLGNWNDIVTDVMELSLTGAC